MTPHEADAKVVLTRPVQPHMPAAMPLESILEPRSDGRLQCDGESHLRMGDPSRALMSPERLR